MKILSSKERASRKGPSDWFTGNVWLDEIAVGVEPGARTAWHTHPVGQTLHVLTGSGLVQLEGQKAKEIHPGDTVVIAPGERHWHGAGPGNTMVHLAIQEMDAQGVNVIWMEPVTDEEYSAQ
jgi:quercetin dioxygenase-like cupin family protein